ncbi:Retrovirus-related Pol polyprotein from transposon 297 [Yarrowia sp. C11]|nr:Retrovirus-related Pol polyprotein from transposon 297 [Yarrowia sp. E02]KAG5369612.1 Retrovirus-related Pol polyprotein from transposon 297 [Yarrowia sp. C11]
MNSSNSTNNSSPATSAPSSTSTTSSQASATTFLPTPQSPDFSPEHARYLNWLRSIYPVHTIPIFTGDAVLRVENEQLACDWLLAVENFLCTFPAPHHARPHLLGSRLYGSAGLWWRQGMEKNILANWPEFKANFVSSWCPEFHSQPQSHFFHKVRQGVAETTAEFAQRRLQVSETPGVPKMFHVSLRRSRKLIYDPDNQVYLCMVKSKRHPGAASLEELELISKNQDMMLDAPPELARSPFCANYGLCHHETEFVEYHVNRMLEEGLVDPTKSVYGAPVLIIISKDGEFRMCTDHRILDDRSINDRFWLPKTDEILSQVGHNGVFSKLNLFSGYHQLFKKHYSFSNNAISVFPLDLREDRDNHLGLSEMQDHLDGCLSGVVFDEFDNLIICSRDRESHSADLDNVLRVLRQRHIYVNKQQSDLFEPSLQLLGHIVEKRTCRPDPLKVCTIVNWHTPSDSTDIASFLHLAGYYRRYIPDFAKIARPVALLCGGNKSFDWSEKCQSAFDLIKTTLVRTVPVRLETRQGSYRLSTEIFETCFSVVLEQQDGMGNFRVVDRKSARFHGMELRFSEYEKNVKAIVYALRKWRIGQGFFMVQTRFPLSRDILLNPAYLKGSSLSRWLHFIQAHQFEVVDISGTNRQINQADLLKRSAEINKADSVVDTGLNPLAKRVCVKT